MRKTRKFYAKERIIDDFVVVADRLHIFRRKADRDSFLEGKNPDYVKTVSGPEIARLKKAKKHISTCHCGECFTCRNPDFYPPGDLRRPDR